MKKLFNNSPILSKLGKRNPFKSNNGKNKDLNDKKEFETPNNNEKRNSLFNNNNPFENDDSYFSIKKTKTSNLFKQRQSAILPENFKLIGLSNFQKDHDFLINSQKRRENKKPAIKYLIHEDTILENEMFMPSPYSYPGDYSNKNKLLQDFDEDYSDSTDDSNLNNSFS
jgi:hypothetical protein